MTGKKLLVSALVVALAQIAFLAWMIMGRAAVLQSGQDVLLKVRPVDPRDLLRGDYVTMDYEIRDVPAAIVSNAPAVPFVTRDGPIFVRLGKDEDGYWRARSASLDEPAGAPPAGEVDMRGMVTGGWSVEPGGSVRVDYGIDRYYVPEGEGKAIEENLRERPFGILAAVGRNGIPQIKALLDGETVLYEEPPY